jgi:hypothetical protein
VKNEEVLHTSQGQRNSLTKRKWRKANWIGHILCRYCFLDHVTEGKIEEVRWKRCQQLLDDLKEKEKILEFETGNPTSPYLENSLWKGCGPVTRQNTQ